LSFDWILMNVVAMVSEILFTANSVIGKSWVPDFSFSTEDGSERVRITAFDQLNSMLQCYVICGSDQEMNMFGHEDEGVDLKSPFAAMSEEGLKEEADIPVVFVDCAFHFGKSVGKTFSLD